MKPLNQLNRDLNVSFAPHSLDLTADRDDGLGLIPGLNESLDRSGNTRQFSVGKLRKFAIDKIGLVHFPL